MNIRIGQGFDAHRLEKGRKLIIGGVEIPYERGLLGHSDADVLTHAVIDAILGAAGLPDIGRNFPDTDPAYKGADSLKLLTRVAELAGEKGWRVGQIDSTIIAQAPKLAPFVDAMRVKLARASGADSDLVSVKAKTTEGMGFAGRGEGIAALAMALLIKE